MNSEMDWQHTQQAWDLAWQTRFCPPDEIIFKHPLDGEAEAHLKSCPGCRRRRMLDESSPPWRELFRAMQSRAAPEAKPEDPRPGQIRSLHSSLAGWGPKERYYNPPVVLILDAARSLPNGVLVAQCYHDPTFMDQSDDVRIGEARFAEPWNIYTIHCKDLGPVQGMAGEEPLRQVKSLSQTSSPELPPWSPKFIFRQMEIELGCFFSAGSVIALMEEYDKAGAASQGPGLAVAASPLAEVRGPARPDWETQSAEDLSHHLRELDLKVPPASWASKPADLYFMSEPLEQKMDLAAADADLARLVPVLAFRMRQGRPVALEYLSAQLMDLIRSPQLILGGRFTSRLDKEDQWQAEFRWRGQDGKMIESQAGRITWQDSEPAYFWTVFPIDAKGVEDIESRLCVRLFSVQRQ